MRRAGSRRRGRAPSGASRRSSLYQVHADGSFHALARDGLGSVRAEVANTGTLTRSSRYAAYGALAQSTGGAPSLLGFAGELTDPSGLIYLRARWYTPGRGGS